MARLSVLLLSIALSLDLYAAGAVRRVFIGSLARKTDVDVAIVTLPDGEIIGATHYPKPGVYRPYFVPLRGIHRLSGKRHGAAMTLVEERSGAEGAAIVARIVRHDLRGTWRMPGRKRLIPFDFWEVFAAESPLLNDARTSWQPLDRMHDDLRAGRLALAAAEARLACAVSDEGCSWVEALPSVIRGVEPPPAKSAPWRGYLLEVQGKRSEAVAEGRRQCANYNAARSACAFLADLASALPSTDQKEIYGAACRWQQVACDHIFGSAEVALAEAAEQGDVAAVEQILRGKVNVNFGNESRYSPLYSAVVANSAPIVRMLLEHGADPNRKYGYSAPLAFVARNQKDEIALLLLEHGAKVAGVADGALWDAVYYGRHAVALKMLANGEDPDDGVPAGSPLTAAVDKRDVAMVKALLEHGADPEYEAKFTDGSPIDHARKTHQARILRMLLAARKRAGSGK
jgi:hypothetical protein